MTVLFCASKPAASYSNRNES